jgi:two-component system nitrogen regulation sensor histidine kinase NtrY
MQTTGDKASGSITIEIMSRSGRLLVSVRDTGCGLPADLRDRLFEPYVTTRRRGTGLGLAIVKRIVEDHAGRLEISNHPEGGAEVRLDFDLEANRALGVHEPEQVTS